MQFFILQVVQHKKWSLIASKQHYFVVKEPFRRGTFFSNTSIQLLPPDHKVAFAIDVPLYHLYADVKTISRENVREICEQILKILSPSVKEAVKLPGEFLKKSRSRRLVSWVDENQKEHFLSWWRRFSKEQKIASNALYFLEDFKRFHPMGHLLGQVLHTVQDRRDENTLKAYPTGGLELSLNGFLEGSVGFRRLMRSPRNSLETGTVLKKPVHGADIELTINHCVQAIAEEELEKAVLRHKAKGGVVVMVSPKTGEILALAQYPFFHPDTYSEYFNNAQKIENSKMKAAYDVNEPGSPMKALTMAIALKANKELKKRGKMPIFSPFEKVDTHSSFLPGRNKPLMDVHMASFLNMYMAMQKSSNIYMAKMASRVVAALGEKWYRNELVSSFGFGQKTGVEFVGESVGLVPKPGKVDANGHLEWSKGTPYTLAIGYNLMVTSLQFARAYCVLANGGFLPELSLVRKITRNVDGVEQVLLDRTKTYEGKKVFDEDDIDTVVKAMKFVTKPGGTAVKADIYGYTEAGKTGTSMKLVNGQYSNQAHFSSFVGFAPAKDPAFVLFVALDEPKVGFIPGLGLNHRGGTCATPLFREIGRRTLAFLGIPMDDPFGFPMHDPRSDLTKADYVQENKKLTLLYEAWNNV